VIDKFDKEMRGNRHRFVSSDGQYIYHIGIIDYLQAYDVEKKSENLLKVWIYQRDGTKISACDPVPYARRFFRFMRSQVIIR
jgi:hypothetical protein